MVYVKNKNKIIHIYKEISGRIDKKPITAEASSTGLEQRWEEDMLFIAYLPGCLNFVPCTHITLNKIFKIKFKKY